MNALQLSEKNFGGLRKIYKVCRHCSIWKSTRDNGYAITAVVGKKDVMKNAKNSFISSTFWTERLVL